MGNLYYFYILCFMWGTLWRWFSDIFCFCCIFFWFFVSAFSCFNSGRCRRSTSTSIISMSIEIRSLVLLGCNWILFFQFTAGRTARIRQKPDVPGLSPDRFLHLLQIRIGRKGVQHQRPLHPLPQHHQRQGHFKSRLKMADTFHHFLLPLTTP